MQDTCGEDAFSSKEDVDELKPKLQKEKELHQTVGVVSLCSLASTLDNIML